MLRVDRRTPRSCNGVVMETAMVAVFFVLLIFDFTSRPSLFEELKVGHIFYYIFYTYKKPGFKCISSLVCLYTEHICYCDINNQLFSSTVLV